MVFDDVNFGLQVSIGMVGKAIGAAIGFFGSIFLARMIGDTGYGAFYFLLSISMFLDNPVTQWGAACRKRMTEANFSTNRAAGAVFLGAGLGSAVLVGGTMLIHFLVGDVNGSDVRFLAVIFVGVVFFTGTKQILAGTANFGFNSWVEVGREVLRVGLQIGLVFVIGDIAGMVFGLTLASLLLVPAVLRLSGVRPERPEVEDIREIFAFAKVSIPNGFVSSAMSQIDILILGTLASSAIVGNYKVATNLLLPSIFVVSTMAPGIMSRVSNLDSRDNDPSDAVTDALSYASILAFPLAAGAIVMGDLVAVTVYSSDFSDAGIFIGWLGAYYVIHTQMRILSSTLSGLDRPDLVLKLNGLGFVINAVLGVGLFYVIGPVGVVYATVVGVLCRYLLGATWVRNSLAVDLLPRPLTQQAVAATLMGGVLYLIRYQFSLSSWLLVIGTVICGGVVYFGILLAISRELRQTAIGITRDGIERVS